MTPRRPLLAALACTALLPSLAGAAGRPPDGAPDLAEIARAGRATLGRLADDAPASWKATVHVPDGGRVEVDVLIGPGRRRTVVSMPDGGGVAEAFRIVERDGAWYATEGQKAGKYRPYEAPFELGTAYHFLALAQPSVVGGEAGGGLGTYEETKDGVATFRSPIDGAQRRQLEQMLAAIEDMKRRDPAAVTPEALELAARMREMVEKASRCGSTSPPA